MNLIAFFSHRPLCLAVATMALTSCGTLKQAVPSVLLGGVGSFVGAELGDDKPEAAALGAAAGVASGALLTHWQDEQRRTAYIDGYQQARSDEVKKLYWLSKALQRPPGGVPTSLRRGYYEIPVPAHRTRDGVAIDAHTQVIEIVE